MRDIHDAKAMAQTMRDELAAKGVSIGIGESLELVSHMFGVADWNTLSAFAHRRRSLRSSDQTTASATHASPSNPGGSSKTYDEIGIAPHILERYVGHYRLGEGSVLTITRKGAQLSAQLTGQPALPIYAWSTTEFFYGAVDAQISFITDAQGNAASLVLHQNGADMAMPRVEAAEAEDIASRTAAKLKNQTQSPGSDAALRRLIDGVMSGEPNFDEMSPALADATRRQLPQLQSGIAGLGAIESIRFLGVGNQGTDVYSVRHERGATHWTIALDSNGTISTAWVVPGP